MIHLRSVYLSACAEFASIYFFSMALHFYSCIFSSKPRIVATKAQHSEYFNPAKVDSLHIANKWNIVQERSSAQVYKTVGPNFMFC